MILVGGRATNNSVTFISGNFQSTCKVNNLNIKSITSRELNEKNDNYRLSSFSHLIKRIPILRGIYFTLFDSFKNKKVGILFLLISLYGIVSPIFEGHTSKPMSVWQINLMLITIAILVILFTKITNMGKFHSAEHMVANNFKQNRDMTIENVKMNSRIHRYCGTNFIILEMLIFCFAINSLDKLYIDTFLLILYLASGIAYEIHVNDNKFLNCVLYPFYFFCGIIQFLIVTSQPSEEHLQIAIEAFNEIERLETNNNDKQGA
ncbi:DUF1385 domain-containing protein (plasmid) [Bacillus velezensis]|uniref:DUF1385 domain-containing protein n=1 Tax=Bacillus velezensis TaxID=492670 RepID=UPI0009881731|nr:DUF1385 domain-containing protein [Bacillus velezensis]AQS42442.1 hypothetical protein BVH55_00150 [Bacillus velezensis]WNR83242.1 DUF1385 domain-containing protein [Bacillus velezensis]